MPDLVSCARLDPHSCTGVPRREGACEERDRPCRRRCAVWR
jgi:hypothetical protein